MATPPSSSTPLSSSTPPSSSTAGSWSPSEFSEEDDSWAKEHICRLAAAGGSLPEIIPTADSLSDIIPTAVRLRGSLGSVKQPQDLLLPPPPVGTGDDIDLIPTPKDDWEASFVRLFQPDEEERFIMLADDDEDKAWGTWIADHVLAFWDPYGPIPVYVRKDSSGDFHTYPSLGGLFSSPEEVGSAVLSHARGSRIDMSEELSEPPSKEHLKSKYLCWPDGTTKLYTRFEMAEWEKKKVHRLVEAVLDKYNDEKKCVGELKDIVHWQSISEGLYEWYYHLNIRLKTKVADDDAGSTNLFFAEVIRSEMRDTLGYRIRAFSSVEGDGDWAICQGCIKNGSTEMKHPLTCKIIGGHDDICFPSGFGPCNEKQWCDPDRDVAKVEERKQAQIQKMFDYLEDDEYMDNLRNKRLHIPKRNTLEKVKELLGIN